jgi:hypothetical protein
MLARVLLPAERDHMADVAHLHFRYVGQYSRCVLCDMEYLTCLSASTRCVRKGNRILEMLSGADFRCALPGFISQHVI